MSCCGRGLSFNHLVFVGHFSLAADLEECIGPNTILEVNAILSMVLVILVRADPLVVDVSELLFQIRPALVPLLRGILSDGQRGNTNQRYYQHNANHPLHCESPLKRTIWNAMRISRVITFSDS